jgi:hypothetical protein
MLKRLFTITGLVVALSVAQLAAAGPKPPGQKGGPSPGHRGGGRGGAVSAPEFDASAAGAALALLVGGALVLAERRRRVKA